MSDAIQIWDAELAELLDELDPLPAGPVAVVPERRVEPRFPYRNRLQMSIGDGTDAPTLYVQSRNLSRSSLGFLHNARLKPNTRCTVFLETLQGDQVPIHAMVVRSRFIRDRVRDVGVRFASPIDITQFVNVAEQSLPIAG